VIRWWDRERRIRNLAVQLDAKGAELHAAHRMLRERESERTALIRHLDIMRVKAYRSDRYRTAWTSARRRANNAAGSVVFWSLAHTREKTARIVAEDQLAIAERVKAEQLDELVAAGQTIRDLQAALDLAVKGHPS
jgi:hypothetical protein